MAKTGTRSCGIGGQAVMEGVMMKNQDRYAIAVRKQDGEIDVQSFEYKSVAPSKLLTKIPFIRGVFNFVDSLVLGTKALSHSSDFYLEEEKEKKPGILEKIFGKNAEKAVTGLTVLFSLVMAIALFMILPYYISLFFKRYILSASLLALVEGVLRILIFVIYITLISMMKDIKRVYMYHGAEHKCINCIEHGYVLNVKNVMKSSKQHKRCGTSFMLLVMFVSVVFFIFIRVENPIWRVVIRLLLIPVIAGVSYEIIRIAGNSNNIFIRIISAPGMWMQRLTTAEPDRKMIEVAIKSVEAVFDWKAYFKETFDYVVEDNYEDEDLEEMKMEEDSEIDKTPENSEAAQNNDL